MNSISIHIDSVKDKELIENIAYICGALRDGYLYEKHYLISIAQKDKQWLEYLQRLFIETFGVKSKIRNLGDAFELRVFSKQLFYFIREFSELEKIKQNKDLWVPFISGFFDAEGHCTSPATYRKTGKKKISFHQNDYESLKFIKNALKEFGVKSGKIYLQKGRNCHALYIQSKNEIMRFASVIKPIRKQSQLNDLVSALSSSA
jgi:intein-encoded DNA endonuclease-like protein